MRLFGYYAIHSFWNQIRKLLKTWVLIFILACALIGGGMGYIIGSMIAEEEAVPDTGLTEQGYFIDENSGEVVYGGEEFSEIPEEAVLEYMMAGETEFVFEEHLNLVSFITGAAVFAILLLSVFGADENGGKLFLPADVNILFSSPMKPQSVLLFRLMTRLGLVLFLCVYYLILAPNFSELGIPKPAIYLVYLLAFAAILYGQILRAFLYIECQNRPWFRRLFTPVLYGILALIFVTYIGFWKSTGLSALDAATALFSKAWMDLIPVWGWTRAFYMAFVGGNIPGGFLWLCVSTAGLAGLFILTMHLKADFYEDAMTKAEETAALLQEAADKGSLITFGKRRKDRGDKILRDGLNKGHGASVYFFTQMYNRRRFSRLGFFTKTSFFYLFAAGLVSVFEREVAGSDNFMVPALVLSGFVFYRAIGNPLERDVSAPYFILIPDSARKKMFASIGGSSVNCLLDLLPGMVLAAILLQANPVLVPAWMLFIATVDFYSSSIGAFIGVTTPQSAGKNIKKIIQVMFLYFGLLPDILLIGFGIHNGHAARNIIISSLVNLILAYIFLSIGANFLEPKGGRQASSREPLSPEMRKKARKSFSRIGLMAVIITGGTNLASLVVGVVLRWTDSPLMKNSIFTSLFSYVLLFCLFDPLGYLSVRRLPVYRGSGTVRRGTGKATSIEANRETGNSASAEISQVAGSTAEAVNAGEGAGFETAGETENASRGLNGNVRNGRLAVHEDEKEKFGLAGFLKAFFICEFFMVTGNLVSRFLMLLIGRIVDITGTDVVTTMILDSEIWWTLGVAVFIGPILEELLFRKVAIDRLSVYGEKKAVLLSALVFALFHGNYYQFLYTFLIGLVWGYIYLRTRKVRNTIFLHMTFNAMGALVPTFIMSRIDLDYLTSAEFLSMTDGEALRVLYSSGFIAYGIYAAFILVAVLTGIVLFFKCVFELRFRDAPVEMERGAGFAICYRNFGMIALTVLSLVLATYTAFFL